MYGTISKKNAPYGMRARNTRISNRPPHPAQSLILGEFLNVFGRMDYKIAWYETRGYAWVNLTTATNHWSHGVGVNSLQANASFYA